MNLSRFVKVNSVDYPHFDHHYTLKIHIEFTDVTLDDVHKYIGLLKLFSMKLKELECLGDTFYEIESKATNSITWELPRWFNGFHLLSTDIDHLIFKHGFEKDGDCNVVLFFNSRWDNYEGSSLHEMLDIYGDKFYNHSELFTAYLERLCKKNETAPYNLLLIDCFKKMVKLMMQVVELVEDIVAFE